MPKFLVKFDDVAFTPESDVDFEVDELKNNHIELLNQQLKAHFSHATGIVSVHSASLSCDSDDIEDGECKVFTSVSLLVETKNEAAAMNFDPPVEVLNAVIDQLKLLNSGSLDNEGQWEVLDVERVIEINEKSIEKPVKSESSAFKVQKKKQPKMR